MKTDISGNAYDLKEAFVDHNEDGFYNPDTTENALAPADTSGSGDLEEFADFNVDNLFTQNDSKYNGVLCSIPAHDGCSSEQQSINVRGSVVLVMSGSNAFFDVAITRDAVSQTIDHDNDSSTAEIANPNYNLTDDVVYIAGESVGSASFIIADLHNQPMPAGSTVSFTSSVGSVVSTSSFTWPNDNHNGGRAYGVDIKGEAEPKRGSLIVEVTTPSGVKTSGSVDIVIQ